MIFDSTLGGLSTSSSRTPRPCMVVPGEVSRRPGPGVLYCRSGPMSGSPSLRARQEDRLGSHRTRVLDLMAVAAGTRRRSRPGGEPRSPTKTAKSGRPDRAGALAWPGLKGAFHDPGPRSPNAHRFQSGIMERTTETPPRRRQAERLARFSPVPHCSAAGSLRPGPARQSRLRRSRLAHSRNSRQHR